MKILPMDTNLLQRFHSTRVQTTVMTTDPMDTDVRPYRLCVEWTHQERVCLHMLWSEYRASNHVRTSVFNEVINGRPNATGEHRAGPSKVMSDELLRRTQKSLECEYSKRPRPGQKASAAWDLVCSPPKTTEEENTRSQVRTRIGDAIALRRKSDIHRLSKSPNHFQQMTPPATPSTSKNNEDKQTTSVISKKRFAEVSYEPARDEDAIGDIEYFPRGVRAKRRKDSNSRQHSPVVLIPRLPSNLIHPDTDEQSTPNALVRPIREQIEDVRSSSETAMVIRHSKDKVLYPRMGNTPNLLPLHKFQTAPPTDKDYHDVPEDEAHPWLPPLLFRYWDDQSRGVNSASGFKSGRTAFARAPPRPAPLCSDLEWTDVLEHLNPNRRLEHPAPSSFISTSNRLIWTIQQALRKLGPTGHISIIDSSALDPRSVYYTPPFHEQLHRHIVFDNGAQYWKGLSEHLVWDTISSPAMLRTFTLSSLCAFAASDAVINRILRLETLKSDCRLDRTIRAFKQDRTSVGNQEAAAIARLAIFFGLSHASPSEALSRIVCEITQGWALFPEDNMSEQSWREKALWFTHALARESGEPVSLARQAEICHAFLDGFKWSRGERGNLTTQYDRAKVLVVEKRAEKIGLADPVGIVVGELAEAARVVRGHGEELRGRLEGLWDGGLAVRDGDEGVEDEVVPG